MFIQDTADLKTRLEDFIDDQTKTAESQNETLVSELWAAITNSFEGRRFCSKSMKPLFF